MIHFTHSRITKSTARVILPAALLATSCVLIYGCESLPRVNHYHNDANQKTAEDALDQFEQFTGGTASLTSVLDQDIQARQSLETTVSNARIQVLDTELANLTTNINWLRLRARLLESIGLFANEGDDKTRPIGPDNPPVSVDDPAVTDARLQELVTVYDPALNTRIELRQARVNQIINVLNLLASVQQALVKQAHLNVDSAAAVLKTASSQATTKPVVKNTDLTRICFLSSILTSPARHRRPLRTRNKSVRTISRFCLARTRRRLANCQAFSELWAIVTLVPSVLLHPLQAARRPKARQKARRSRRPRISVKRLWRLLSRWLVTFRANSN